MSKNSPIGIFDSGIGGLTVARAVKDLLPEEQIIYFGDTLHLPYGEKSPESIRKYSTNITSFLKEKNCKAVLIACNSASSVAFETTKSNLSQNTIVLNVIDPLVEYVKTKFEDRTVGVIGTKATINSNIYQDKLGSHCTVKALSTPLLAPMIEEGFIDNKISSTVIEEYLKNNELSNIEALLLGCTHYPIIHKEIEAIYSNLVEVLDSNIRIAKALNEELEKNGLCSEKLAAPDEFYVSDKTASFEKSTQYFFGKQISLTELKLD